MIKRLLVLFFISNSLAFAQNSVLSKKISLDISNGTLEDVLKALNKIYSLEFSYSDDVIPVTSKVSISSKEEDLKDFLDKLFFNLDIEYKVINSRIVLKKRLQHLTQTIRGVIVDESSNAPILGASILVLNTDPPIGGATDVEGKFKIAQVPVGRQTFSITCIGYQPKVLPNILLGSGKEMVFETKLSESVTSIGEVVVTADKNETKPLNEMVLVSARSFSVEETKRYAASMSDPARMASGFAGITGANDETNALIIRGNSPRGLLWRVEGIEIPNPNHFSSEGASSGSIGILSSNMIDNSDFLTGAFPASYGNALSGVFDMHLRSGNNEKREYTFQAGLLGIEAAAEGPFSKKNPASYLVNYRYSTLSVLDKIGFDLNDAGEYNNYQDLSFKMNCPTRTLGTFSLFGIGGLSRSDQKNTSLVENNYSDMGVIGLTHHKVFGDNTSIKTTCSLSGTHISNLTEQLALNDDILKVEENYIKSYARGTLTLKRRISQRYFVEGGIIYSALFYNFYLRDRNSFNNPAYQNIINFDERGNGSLLQSYASAKQKISPSLTAFYGVHSMYFSLDKDYTLEPRLALNWKINAFQSFNLGYGLHSRVENLQYYFARKHLDGGIEKQFNKSLGYTKSQHYVIGYEQTLKNNLRFKFETYYQNLFNAPSETINKPLIYSSINVDTGFITDSLSNSGRGRNYGIELSLEKSFSDNYYLMINGSMYRSKYSIKDEEERNTVYNGHFNTHLLAGKEFLVGKYKKDDIIGLNFKATWSGGRRYIPIDLERSIIEGKQVDNKLEAFVPKLPNYFRLDIQINYKKNKPGYSMEWRLDVQNFTNHLNPQYYYYNASARKIDVKYQIGWLPVLNYRIEF